MIKVTTYGICFITGFAVGLEYFDDGEDGFAIAISIGFFRLLFERYTLTEEEAKEEDLLL